MTDGAANSRIEGLDLARFVAFVGMVIVNFKIVMGASDDGSVLSFITSALEGRAAATFVVLAGIGIGLAALRSEHKQVVSVTLKRSAFLLALGLINSLIFPADILHYYALYFSCGVLLLPVRSRWLVLCIVFLNIAFVAMIFAFDYNAGWNWSDYSYAGFWTPEGFLRNLFFNGWHPVVPWLGFLIYGIILSRIPLVVVRTQHRLILFGVACVTVAHFTGDYLTIVFTNIDPGLAILATTSPVPPMPLYTLAGVGAASIAIGICLRVSGWFEQIGVLRILIPAGKQTLTLYMAHILIGMGVLEACQLLGGQTLVMAVASALVFCLSAVIYALLWSRMFKRGPIEAMMRFIDRS